MLIVVWMKYFNLHCMSTNHVLCEVILSELLQEPLQTKKIQTLLSNNSLWAVKREGCRVCSYHNELLDNNVWIFFICSGSQSSLLKITKEKDSDIVI